MEVTTLHLLGPTFIQTFKIIFVKQNLSYYAL